MRNAVEYEEEENESEITLNATTLLGIFFGLVLVCGVFFGFGYSVGRRGAANSANSPASAASTNTQPETPAPQPASIPKPSAMEALQTANSASDADGTTVTEPADNQSAPALKPAPVAKPRPVEAVAQPAQDTKPALKPAALPVTSSAASPATGTFMVQIAAVSHQEDANTLANALRQHGYSVSVRSEAQDKLFHIQVGPFASRDSARAMRSRLQADGYNAILKP
jgi:cell division septation protein DedD